VRVNLRRARELLAERGDRVEQSTLSRYVSKYADALDPRRDGRELTIDFEALIQHRGENINRAASAPSSAPASVSISKGRANEAALNIRAQRQMRELEIAERIGALTPTREVRAAAAEAMSALRNAFACAQRFGLRPRQRFQHRAAACPASSEGIREKGLEAFARALMEKDLVVELEPVDA
jgi:hypothetical protein